MHIKLNEADSVVVCKSPAGSHHLLKMSEDRKFRIGVDVGGKVLTFSFNSRSGFTNATL